LETVKKLYPNENDEPANHRGPFSEAELRQMHEDAQRKAIIRLGPFSKGSSLVLLIPLAIILSLGISLYFGFHNFWISWVQ
jgi:hypothetical protein